MHSRVGVNRLLKRRTVAGKVRVNTLNATMYH